VAWGPIRWLDTDRAACISRGRWDGFPPGRAATDTTSSALSKTMCQLAHDVRQRTHNPRADPEIPSRRSLEPYRSHQEAENKANCDNRQCDDDEPGEKRCEHEKFKYSPQRQCGHRDLRKGFLECRVLWELLVSVVKSSTLVECRWSCRIQPCTETEMDLICRNP
jgi:hypothetical protein